MTDKTLVYIIHAAADRDLAGFLKIRIEALPKTSVFVASKAGDIPTGKPWLSEVHRNLREATAFVVLLTPRSIERNWIWYEAGVARYTERLYIPVAAGGLDRSKIQYPIGADQVLALDEADGAMQMFKDLGGSIDDAHVFCSTVRKLAASEIDEARVRQVRQTFGKLSDLMRFVIRQMLARGGATFEELTAELASQRYVSDGPSVERVVQALEAIQFVDSDVEGRIRIRPELEGVIRQCFVPPSLSERMIALSEEILVWVGDEQGRIDQTAFEAQFRHRLSLLSEKARRDHADGDEWLERIPSAAATAREVAKALVRVAARLPQ